MESHDTHTLGSIWKILAALGTLALPLSPAVALGLDPIKDALEAVNERTIYPEKKFIALSVVEIDSGLPLQRRNDLKRYRADTVCRWAGFEGLAGEDSYATSLLNHEPAPRVEYWFIKDGQLTQYKSNPGGNSKRQLAVFDSVACRNAKPESQGTQKARPSIHVSDADQNPMDDPAAAPHAGTPEGAESAY